MLQAQVNTTRMLANENLAVLDSVHIMTQYIINLRDGMDKMHAGIGENLRFMEASRNHPRIRGTFGLHASLPLNDEALKACREALPHGIGAIEAAVQVGALPVGIPILVDRESFHPTFESRRKYRLIFRRNAGVF